MSVLDRKEAKIIVSESGDIKVYCYINDQLDKIVGMRIMQEAVKYMEDYVGIERPQPKVY